MVTLDQLIDLAHSYRNFKEYGISQKWSLSWRQ